MLYLTKKAILKMIFQFFELSNVFGINTMQMYGNFEGFVINYAVGNVMTPVKHHESFTGKGGVLAG